MMGAVVSLGGALIIPLYKGLLKQSAVKTVDLLVETPKNLTEHVPLFMPTNIFLGLTTCSLATTHDSSLAT